MDIRRCENKDDQAARAADEAQDKAQDKAQGSGGTSSVRQAAMLLEDRGRDLLLGAALGKRAGCEPVEAA